MARSISIAGGGLAGLTLGLLLRQRGIGATVWEAASYPRHRVCGEFISGSGLKVLERAGLLARIQHSGGRPAHSAALFTRRGDMISFELPEAALCVSRYRLDALLAEQFESAGGALKRKSRWTESFAQEGLVRATGRRPPPPREGFWKWFGLKVHCHNVTMVADLEMHFRRDGYIGLCRLPDGEVNLCGLFRSRSARPELAAQWKPFLAGDAKTALHHKLRDAVYDEASFCAIAALDPHGSQLLDSAEMRIGDSLGMIPPVTGNGMSIAFESAEIAADSLEDYSREKITWIEAKRSFQQKWSEQSAMRLRLDRLLHPFLFNEVAQRLFFSNGTLTRWLLRKIFHGTR
jgi:2-polyprenyl-6-methoxyphenol hydroxylase-like FAD-dependent oxidoreductase